MIDDIAKESEVSQCMQFETYITCYLSSGVSNKVAMCVFMIFIREILMNQSDPEQGINNLIKEIKSWKNAPERI